MAKRFTVTLVNWEKHNPRKDYKRPTWFALSNRFLEDPDFMDFEPIELKATLYIFCQASQRNSATVPIVPAHAHRVCEIEPEILIRTIEKLEAIGAVRSSVQTGEQGTVQTAVQTTGKICTDSVRDPNATDRHTDIHTFGGGKPRARKQLVVSFANSEELRFALGGEWMGSQREIYPDADYLERELKKAFVYYSDNKRKCPTTIGGWKRTLASWFDRGWARHQAGIPTAKTANSDIVED